MSSFKNVDGEPIFQFTKHLSPTQIQIVVQSATITFELDGNYDMQAQFKDAEQFLAKEFNQSLKGLFLSFTHMI